MNQPEQESSRGRNTPHAKLYLTTAELAELSGFSVPTLRRLKRQGQLQAIQPGGPGTKAMFARDALEQTRITTPGSAAPPAPHRKGDARSGPQPAWQKR